jgi:hypothetical protein
MDGGNQLVAGSADSEVLRTNDSHTAHSPVFATGLRLGDLHFFGHEITRIDGLFLLPRS